MSSHLLHFFFFLIAERSGVLLSIFSRKQQRGSPLGVLSAV